MSRSRRSAQDAMGRLTAASDGTPAGKPQRIACGDGCAVVVAADEYEQMRRFNQAQEPSFVQLLLAIPQADEPFEQLAMRPRDVEL